MPATGLKGFNLSTQQARLWSVQGESHAYRAQCAMRLEGPLNIAILQHTLQSIVDRHGILRTAFCSLPGMEIPLQLVAQHIEVICQIVSLESISQPRQTAILDSCFSSLQHEVFAFKQEPLMQISLFCLSLNTHILFISLPALCADDTTLMQFVAELSQVYALAARGKALAEEPPQYVDVAAWQDELLAEEDTEQHCRYWHKMGLSRLAALRLPFEGEQVEHVADEGTETGRSQAFRPHMLEIPVEEELATRIRRQAIHYGVSVSACLLTCWQAAFWHLTDEPDFIMGVACNGRVDEELTHALGLYTRFLPISMFFSGFLPFEQALVLVHASLEKAFEEQVYFRWAAERAEEHDPLPLFFPVTFDYNFWPGCFEADRLIISYQRHYCCTEPFILKLSVLQVGERFSLELHYDPERFTVQQIQRLGSILHTVLHNAMTQPQTVINELPLLSTAQQERLLQMFRAPMVAPSKWLFHQLFEAQTAQRPDQLALISGTERLTYSELNSRANQLAYILRRFGVGPNVLVGLCLSRSVHMIVALLAVLKAGGAYVPLDSDSPPARLAYQLKDIGSPLVLTQHTLLSRLPDGPGQILCLESIQEEVARAVHTNLTASSGSQDLAYVIYTSGSTGIPKGVLISHQSVVNYTLALCDLLGGKPGWHYATVSTLAADLGNTAIFCALASGGCLQVLDYATLVSGDAFAHWNEQHPIDVLKIVPSHLSALLTTDQARALLPRRVLVLGGEVLPLSLLERLGQIAGDYHVFNHYGPTETTVGALVNPLGIPGNWGDQIKATSRTVPLGRPITNTEAYVLGRGMQVLPVGVVGELYLGGGGVAMGYLQEAEKTAERFIPHPFQRQAGTRLYRTGDLARYTDQGQIEFVGRHDSQVKLRGYRIELGEIEAILRRHINVQDAAVVLHEENASDPRIVGYVVTQDTLRLTSETLCNFLREYVPEYMIPSTFLFLDALPLTTNGKIDRQRLPRPEEQRNDLSPLPQAPRSPIEEILLEIWSNLLPITEIGIYDNFFQLGGHSLLATQVISRIGAVLHVELPIFSIFEAPTIAQLAQQIESALHKEQVREVPPLLPIRDMQELPLSFAQQRLWFLDQLEPQSTAYLIAHPMQFYGALDYKALMKSLRALAQRHEVLRTTFPQRAGQPRQVIHPVEGFQLPVIDLLGLELTQRESEAQRLVRQEILRPFDLAQGPLWRVSLLRLSSDLHILLSTVHHIITDGWSNRVFRREAAALYQAFAAGEPDPLAPLSIQYADFAYWQRQWLQGKVLETQLSYWKLHLANLSTLELPTDYLRPPTQSHQGAYRETRLPAALSRELIALSQQENVTLFMFLLSAFQVLLARYSGQSDISVGTAIANRTHTELEGLIGFFANTLVMRSDLSGNPSFRELLGRVREVCLGAYMHQDVPFEYLVEALQPRRDLSRSPLFQVVLNVIQPISEAVDARKAGRGGGVKLTGLQKEHTATKVDLTFTIINVESGFHCGIEYSVDLFSAETIQRLLLHWQVLLEGIVAAPTLAIADLPLLSAAERYLLLQEWALASTQTSAQSISCLHTLFEAQVARTPHALALVSEQCSLTYQALNCYANQLAHALQQLGVGPEVLVGVHTARSPIWLIAHLAILKAGGGYVPFDPTYPPERIARMLSDARVSLLLTDRPLPEIYANQPAQVLFLQQIWPLLQQQPQDCPDCGVQPDDVAYVIYTSGSTGTPKGVQVTHRGVGNLAQVQQQAFGVEPDSHILQFSSLSFDASIWEVIMALLSGACLYMASQERLLPGAELLSLLHKWAITTVTIPPSALAVLSTRPLPALKTLIVAGEACPVDVVQRWAPGRSFWNCYGPTEATVCASMTTCLPDGQPPSIGTSIANTQLYVLDRHLHLVPPGVPGELYIGGIGLARGYLYRTELTAERFVPHPFSSLGGERLYKTGDLVRYRSDGTLDFLGRLDQQVKIRGYRVELGEVETVLQKLAGVSEGVVVLREDTPGNPRLVGYVVGKAGQEGLDGRHLRAGLQQLLPDYMLPAQIVCLSSLPQTSSGKVDRQALLPPEQYSASHASKREEGNSPIEQLLQKIWGEVLEDEQIGIHDNFFALGGHSLLATRTLARVCAELQLELPLRIIFEAPTIAEFALLLEQEKTTLIEQADTEELARMLAELEDLSENEITTMLTAEVSGNEMKEQGDE